MLEAIDPRYFPNAEIAWNPFPWIPNGRIVEVKRGEEEANEVPAEGSEDGACPYG